MFSIAQRLFIYQFSVAVKSAALTLPFLLSTLPVVDLSSLVDNHQIQDGDVILVPKKGYLVDIDRFNRAAGPVLAPLSGFFGLLNIFGLFD